MEMEIRMEMEGWKMEMDGPNQPSYRTENCDLLKKKGESENRCYLLKFNFFHGLPPQQDVDLSSVVIRPSVDGDGTVHI